MRFYFFKVTLSYFDDEKKTFFITPDQSETDDNGVPFSENGLQNTPEFREFVKKTKATLIDVDYTEYAVEYEPKKSDLLNKPVTSESFAELEKSGQYEIVDQNQFQFILVLKKQKKSSSRSNKSYVVCLMIAAVIVLGVLAYAYGALNKRNTENVTSNISASSEVSEISSDDVSDNSGEDEISDTSSEENSSALDESSANSTNSENTHEVTSDSSSSGNTNNESGSDSSDDTPTSSAGTESNSNTAIGDQPQNEV